MSGPPDEDDVIPEGFDGAILLFRQKDAEIRRLKGELAKVIEENTLSAQHLLMMDRAMGEALRKHEALESTVRVAAELFERARNDAASFGDVGWHSWDDIKTWLASPEVKQAIHRKYETVGFPGEPEPEWVPKHRLDEAEKEIADLKRLLGVYT